ncbi:adenylate/guanylate cyclase domain-containing protein [Fulvivirgaceae bacterium BMA10]|uniref:Adenylate/guanylate cyclase domain-containing protein n=1 Tax=Splendidivirga corallicola TaxID=3051826 RepID=A0ABT8KVH9_9BACT|nr:adenylate/guanylate cyclase domain-containing protein [Fulvivirgaceae bacterium BMA10]
MNFARSNKTKTQIKKVVWITLGWTLVAIFQFFSSYATLTIMKCDLTDLDPMIPFKGSLLTGVLAGILGGSGVVFLWEKWLRTKNYGRALFSIFISYNLIYLAVAIPSGLFFHTATLALPIYDAQVWEALVTHLLSLPQLQSYLFWLFVVIATLIILLVNDKYGPGVFQSFLLGKYFHPKKEERIFMFLDLRSSTSIAEKLGEELYFNFLKDVFKHATPGILYYKGEVYQYVGDEIVISWKTDRGTENNNCLHCFFEVQQRLEQKASYYLETYGIIPEFKAGLHYGHVMAGEIGVVKRDIAFSGDVLNTTSRIQDKCNELGVNILLSKFLVDKLTLPTNSFQAKEIGDMSLRGKEGKVMLFTV